ncbi:hypothetical protein DOLIC_00053 [Dolichomitus sp. PSUC_FEM 10030005]|nr:hypothetical protein [Dolichomitus sp. PSUC_FEM 10030005]
MLMNGVRTSGVTLAWSAQLLRNRKQRHRKVAAELASQVARDPPPYSTTPPLPPTPTTSFFIF